MKLLLYFSVRSIFIITLFFLNFFNALIHLSQKLFFDFFEGFFLSSIIGVFITFIIKLMILLIKDFKLKSFFKKFFLIFAVLFLLQGVFILLGAYIIIMLF